jgi:hypothetical protein
VQLHAQSVELLLEETNRASGPSHMDPASPGNDLLGQQVRRRRRFGGVARTNLDRDEIGIPGGPGYAESGFEAPNRFFGGDNLQAELRYPLGSRCQHERDSRYTNSLADAGRSLRQSVARTLDADSPPWFCPEDEREGIGRRRHPHQREQLRPPGTAGRDQASP